MTVAQSHLFDRLREIYPIMTTQFGIDLVQAWRGLARLPGYFRDRREFKKRYRGRMRPHPWLHDRDQQAGVSGGEYFLLDLYVARRIYETNPRRHVDIGSRIDGFVAHVASFREIEVIDVRPMSPIPGIIFRKADLCREYLDLTDYCDSLSCLHALEHFGLGRYGDAIDPEGYKTGFRNMVRILRHGGIFYLSVPLGVERVEFNAHRILDPSSIMELAREHHLELVTFAWCSESGAIRESSDPKSDMRKLGLLPYTLGIFVFQRLALKYTFLALSEARAATGGSCLSAYPARKLMVSDTKSRTAVIARSFNTRESIFAIFCNLTIVRLNYTNWGPTP